MQLSFWGRLCIHACYHNWNLISLILRDDWVEQVWRDYGPTYPGWRL